LLKDFELPLIPPVNASVLHGDCLDILKTMADNSVDSIITDPPYGLTANKKGGTGVASVNLDNPYGRSKIGTGNGAGGFMGMKWDSEVPRVEIWAECLRVLKPGGHLLAFAGTRTQHRMAVNIEDAGFEIRDMLCWTYGSGFPKSLDVSKSIDKAAGARGHDSVGFNVAGKTSGLGVIQRPELRSDHPDYVKPQGITPEAQQWAGWGTALKPALEPITLARKPLIGTVAENVLKWGTGAINVDGCRVGTTRGVPASLSKSKSSNTYGFGATQGHERELDQNIGRFPANLLHSGEDCVVAMFPYSESGAMMPHHIINGSENRAMSGPNQPRMGGNFPASSGSAARFFNTFPPDEYEPLIYCSKASKKDREAGLGMFQKKPSFMVDSGSTILGDGREQRDTLRANHHPTVKPTKLMQHLCRLITPPGGTVLDPFAGSGSTGKAAVLENFNFIGIEREADYVELARARIGHVQKQPVQRVLL
jgi:DNA modification methylase